MFVQDAAVAEVASEAAGLFTRAIALEQWSPKQLRYRLAKGTVVHVVGEVYRFAAAPLTWHQQLQAIDLWAKKGFAFSHETAAALHGLGAFKQEGRIALTSTTRMRTQPWFRVYRVEALSHTDKEDVEGLPVTKVPRTLFDLAARTDRTTLRSCVDQALREKKTTMKALEREVSRSKNRPGVRDMRELLRELKGQGGPTDSKLEDLCLETISAAGLPRPTVQRSLVVGRRRRRLDLLYEEHGVVIEADGFASHSGIDSFEDDRQRNNSLIASGFRVLHWTWTALHERPDELIAELIAALNLRH
jgi:very-short-patch-repair endonuclease